MPASVALNATGNKTWKKVSDFERDSNLCDSDAVLSQLSYQSHMRVVVCGLAVYVDVLLGPSIINKVTYYIHQ